MAEGKPQKNSDGNGNKRCSFSLTATSIVLVSVLVTVVTIVCIGFDLACTEVHARAITGHEFKIEGAETRNIVISNLDSKEIEYELGNSVEIRWLDPEDEVPELQLVVEGRSRLFNRLTWVIFYLYKPGEEP